MADPSATSRPGARRAGADAGARPESPAHLDEDREFLSPSRSITETPPSPIRMALAGAICLLFTLAIIAGFVGRVDIYAEAQGRIQPVGRSKVVQPLEAGKVLSIDVRDGSRVSVGQVLLILDPTQAAADRETALGKQGDLSAEIARRSQVATAAGAGRLLSPSTPTYPPEVTPDLQARETALMRADLANLSASLASLRAKIAESETQAAGAKAAISAHRQTISTLGQRVEIRSNLQRQGWESRANVLDVQDDLDRERTALTESTSQLSQAGASAQTLQRQMQETVSKFMDDNAQALRDAQNKLDQARQDFVKADDQLKHTRLVSPIEGVVQQLAVTTLGQVVTQGQQLMTIVPANAPLEIEAEMQNKDIGFVRVGQPAVVKVEAFPFSRYGVISGRVTRVSHDAVTSQEASTNDDTRTPAVSAQTSAASPTAQVQNLVYPVTVRLDRPSIRVDGREVRLGPGMSVTVEVKTGDRRAISYVLSPFTEVTSEAGHER